VNAWICQVCEEDIRTECECPECPDCRRCGEPRCPINDGGGCAPMVVPVDPFGELWDEVTDG
jgi:hypothetical protein